MREQVEVALQQRPPLDPIRLAWRAGAAPATPALHPIADV